MKTMKPLSAALAVAILAVTGAAVAQVSADKTGKSTSGNTPVATPVTPGAPGHPLSGTGDDPAYGRYWTALDANGDGKVTRDEYLNYYGKRYDSYDTTKRGYYDRQSARSLYLEREMSKTDGQPKGDPLNPTTKK
ncbi:hypothetical protein DSM104443_02131 [Usitatibacter rugosus]|uniref:EF-hand domain-containing protein n=1 Tax=Usitatibacter rugosus TaxID=2732067 RepID=A0A6M4GUR5_9PROT|nr:hypothetical protein [Usitatibacter rugosus]QJR11060.1 hypothetical protein DSM104443_02131 [Usitatibacter rugosus]